MTKINIGFDIQLEKLIETRALIQANSGGGKSYLLRKFIEQVHGKAPYIILDLEEKAISKSKIAIRSGYSGNSGGFNNSLGKLRTWKYIEGRGDSQITELGRIALGDFLPLPAPGADLHNYWISELPKCESMILRHLINVYPQACNKDEIADYTQYSSNSGGFNNALGKLRTLELIDGRGEMKASASLFE